VTTPFLPRTSGLSRRSFLASLGVGTAGAALGLSGCGSAGSSSGATTITFYQSKPEVIGYFDGLIEQFHAAQSQVRVIHDSTSLIAPGFVRGTPPDLACYNYNLEVSRYVERGVLTDLGDLPAAQRISPDVQELVDQFATYPGRTSVLPYSITAASVIYNKALFAAHGVEVPTTWSQFLGACETFKAAGVTPIYGTFKDVWTIQQGAFDYMTGGALDVAGFFQRLKAQGTEVGPDSPVSFSRDFAEPVNKMVQLRGYINPDAGTRGYPDGNLAFAQGTSAMYFQGPWALGEIEKSAPGLEMGTFPLPVTEDPADRKVRVNLDLALWIPTVSTKQEAAREFLSFLMEPEIMNQYNADNLAFGVTRDAPAATDPRITGMQEFVDRNAFYQGAATYIPNSIPVGNYLQSALADGDGAGMLRTLDNDWRRLALRS
jgi:raffinose/stachyose/melibiose transport system substrate-binding protein